MAPPEIDFQQWTIWIVNGLAFAGLAFFGVRYLIHMARELIRDLQNPKSSR